MLSKLNDQINKYLPGSFIVNVPFAILAVIAVKVEPLGFWIL